MPRTVIGLFDDRITARRVEQELESAQFSHERILLAVTAPQHALAGEGIPVIERHGEDDRTVSRDEMVSILQEHGVDPDKARLYAAAIAERGAAVILRGLAEEDSERAARIMLQNRPADPSRRLEAFHELGFGGYNAAANPFAEDGVETERNPHADEHHGEQVAVVYCM